MQVLGNELSYTETFETETEAEAKAEGTEKDQSHRNKEDDPPGFVEKKAETDGKSVLFVESFSGPKAARLEADRRAEQGHRKPAREKAEAEAKAAEAKAEAAKAAKASKIASGRTGKPPAPSAAATKPTQEDDKGNG